MRVTWILSWLWRLQAWVTANCILDLNFILEFHQNHPSCVIPHLRRNSHSSPPCHIGQALICSILIWVSTQNWWSTQDIQAWEWFCHIKFTGTVVTYGYAKLQISTIVNRPHLSRVHLVLLKKASLLGLEIGFYRLSLGGMVFWFCILFRCNIL